VIDVKPRIGVFAFGTLLTLSAAQAAAGSAVGIGAAASPQTPAQAAATRTAIQAATQAAAAQAASVRASAAPVAVGPGAAVPPVPPGQAAAPPAAPQTAGQAAPPPAGAPGAGAPTQPQGKVSGVAIYGAYLMRHTRNEDGSAEAHFSPPLPLDSRLLTGAMQSLARTAFGDGIEMQDPDRFKPGLGSVVKLQDLNYEYRFILDGTPKAGVGLILVQRKELPPPEDTELLKELEQLEKLEKL
jgi:hypothetical protein